MDFCGNVSVSGDYQQDSKLNGLFFAQTTEMDMSLDWLSTFEEDCLTSTGNSYPSTTSTKGISKAIEPLGPHGSPQSQRTPTTLQEFVVPGKARSKKRRATTMAKSETNPLTIWSQNLNPNDQNLNLASPEPPLLIQGMWLADSELIVPKKEEKSRNVVGNCEKGQAEEEVEDEREVLEMGKGNLEQQARRCSHCQAQRTPQWRAGPLGPKTLCNACGVRYKSGRLLPEYRPAKSPTFVSHLHSNSHKKVLEKRMTLSSVHSEQ